MNLTGNTILITGGTSGIGRALAETFHRLDNQVIITGRRQHLLDEITAAHPGMHSMQHVVEDPLALDALAASIQKQFPALNVLINNAGITSPEDLTADTIDVSVVRSIIQTNIVSVLQLTAALLPTLKQLHDLLRLGLRSLHHLPDLLRQQSFPSFLAAVAPLSAPEHVSRGSRTYPAICADGAV